MGRKPSTPAPHDREPSGSLAAFACPNPECSLFNRFDAGDLSVVERIDEGKHIRRLYCSTGKHRFTERQGPLLRYTKLPESTVVRIIKCLGYGCSLEATADICEVDPRTVARLLEAAGRRADDFHRRQLERLAAPVEAVQLDELHGRAGGDEPAKKGGAAGPRGAVAARAGSGSTPRRRSSAGS
jgi:transposase-like protein